MSAFCLLILASKKEEEKKYFHKNLQNYRYNNAICFSTRVKLHVLQWILYLKYLSVSALDLYKLVDHYGFH